MFLKYDLFYTICTLVFEYVKTYVCYTTNVYVEKHSMG